MTGAPEHDDLTRVDVFLDGGEEPIVSYRPPVNFELDTTRLEDGEHLLRIVAYDSGGTKGVREIPFMVRNGPGIAVHGLAAGDVVDGKLPVLVNAFGGANERLWEPARVETPAPIPTWTWVLVLFVVAFGVYYAVRNWGPTGEFVGTPTFPATDAVAAGPALPGRAAVPAPSAAAAGPSSAAPAEVAGAAPAGEAGSEATGPATPAPGSSPSTMAVSSGAGATVYGNNCSACHQVTGQGLPGVFPPLVGSGVVLDPDPTEHVRVVLNGRQGSTIAGVTYASPMPAFAGQLTDEQIAAVVNHERASWGNSAPGVTAAQVSELRSQ